MAKRKNKRYASAKTTSNNLKKWSKMYENEEYIKLAKELIDIHGDIQGAVYSCSNQREKASKMIDEGHVTEGFQLLLYVDNITHALIQIAKEDIKDE